LDYEHVPFHYRKFHEHGHLFQDYPINIPKKVNKGNAPVDQEGFLNVPNKKKSNKKSTILIPSTQASSNKNNLKNMMDKVEDLPSSGNTSKFPTWSQLGQHHRQRLSKMNPIDKK